MSTKSAKLTFNDTQYDFPVVQGSEGELGIEIGQLRDRTGLITLDEGFASTGSTRSAITYIDGERGILRYRGYRIEELCEKANFMEVAYLLIHGELPNEHEYQRFDTAVRRHTMIMEDIKQYYDVWPRHAHPMALLSSVVSALSTYYEDSLDPFDAHQVQVSIHRLLAKLPTIAAFSYKKSIGQPKIYPLNKLSYPANILHMMFAVPTEEYEVDPDIEQAVDKLLIIHGDHEQNCSTATVRMVGSSQANLFATVAAGVLALWGPLHGGANQAVIEMLQQIHDDGGNLRKWIDRAKDKSDPFRLMGFGHRVYRNFDPRSTILREASRRVLEKLGKQDPLLDIAIQLEGIALQEEYFLEKKLYPNVDFYSGLILRAIGFPLRMFPVVFALGRLPGWIAHWKEMMDNPNTRIARPRQIYTGNNERPYVPIQER
ncbi:MAG: citrate synthase [Gammaproteobacteria bacterium]